MMCIQQATARHNLWMIPKEKRGVIALIDERRAIHIGRGCGCSG
jgi:hypothetical protein